MLRELRTARTSKSRSNSVCCYHLLFIVLVYQNRSEPPTLGSLVVLCNCDASVTLGQGKTPAGLGEKGLMEARAESTLMIHTETEVDSQVKQIPPGSPKMSACS